MLMNDEQRAAYRDALDEERVGYVARKKAAEAEGDADGAKRWQRQIAEVDAEKKRSLEEDDLATEDDVGEPAAKTTEPPAPAPGAEIDATDGAKKLATDNNVDLTQVTGTGTSGRITQPDVQKHIDEAGN